MRTDVRLELKERCKVEKATFVPAQTLDQQNMHGLCVKEARSHLHIQYGWGGAGGVINFYFCRTERKSFRSRYLGQIGVNEEKTPQHMSNR